MADSENCRSPNYEEIMKVSGAKLIIEFTHTACPQSIKTNHARKPSANQNQPVDSDDVEEYYSSPGECWPFLEYTAIHVLCVLYT